MLNISPRKINNVYFKASVPPNYRKVDDFVSRSAQPTEANFLWLKEQGVTDVVNFRTMFVPAVDFDEEQIVTGLKMKYHNIPLTESDINNETGVEAKIVKFFELIGNTRDSGAKIHMHCKAGVDRTGFFSLLYKCKYGLDNFTNCAKEMVEMGHHRELYPKLIDYAKKVVAKFN